MDATYIPALRNRLKEIDGEANALRFLLGIAETTNKPTLSELTVETAPSVKPEVVVPKGHVAPKPRSGKPHSTRARLVALTVKLIHELGRDVTLQEIMDKATEQKVSLGHSKKSPSSLLSTILWTDVNGPHPKLTNPKRGYYGVVA